MERDKTRILLENVFARLERDPESARWRLVGTVTDGERDALVEAVVAFGGTVAPSAQVAVSRFVPVPSGRAADLNLDSLKRASPDCPEILLCLDFGTAMSKAMATRDADDNLVELALGKGVGDPGEIYGLRSSMFIARSGRIYFGHEAVAQSNEVESTARKRLDSLKQRMSQGRPGDLSEGMFDVATNPTSVPISWADAITLYLGYLTDIATSELKGARFSRYVKRRFARPCWEQGRAMWADGELRAMLARAQVIADTFHGRWSGGIPLDEAKATIDKVAALDQIPEYLVAEGVEEPIAAAASRLESQERERGLFVVLDIGAGTSDFAAFWVNQDPEAERFTVWQIPGTIDALAQAGDTIDGYLHGFILEKAHLRPGQTDYEYASSRLALEIRQAKETLIRAGEVDVVLSNSSRVKVTKDEFLACDAVQDFGRLLSDRLAGVLTRADGSWLNALASFEQVGRDYISLVLTGGGSALPVVQDLAKGIVEVRGRRFKLMGARSVPAWIEERYPGIISSYQKMAVAIGGAARKLPQLGPATPAFGGIGGKGGWALSGHYAKGP